MAASAWLATDSTRTLLQNGTLQIGVDTFKMALFQSTSNLSTGSTTYAGLTNEVANANGYTTGGQAITWVVSGTQSVKDTLSASITWNASGGPITARYAVIYEVGGNILCYCLLDATPADVTAPDGNPLTITANASGIITFA
jgi:hypothetical protein